MKSRSYFLLAITLLAAGVWALTAQNKDIVGNIVGGEKPKVAVIDFRGASGAQGVMDTFNGTLTSELAGSGRLDLVPKTFYPLQVPQQPADFAATAAVPAKLTDWSNPPVGANYLAFGYTAVQDGRLVLFGYLYNVGQPDVSTAQVLNKLYFGTLDAAGARQVARDFAADILQKFGVVSLVGSKIFFASDRSGSKEIWSMDYDGTNEKQMTSYKSISNMPAVSADGKSVAFVTLTKDNWEVRIHSTETNRRLPFYSLNTSTVATPEFTPDGKHVVYSAQMDGWMQLCMADFNGGNLERISHVRATDVSPKINPKTGRDLLFISSRSGRQQLWHMNMDGTGAEMLTQGDGDVANPAWSPNGQTIAFAWTRGFEQTGNFNIFVMNIATKQTVQLTKEGRNENPWWAPDGTHLSFSAKRGAGFQIYSMLADGTGVRALTTRGNNTQPVWSKGIN